MRAPDLRGLTLLLRRLTAGSRFSFSAAASAVGVALAAALPAEATTSGSLPWDNILTTIAESVQGPVISALVIMGICAGGAYWFFTESQRGLVQIVKVLVVAGIVSGLTAFLGAFGISMALV
jgi:type IV secretion system protein VirB2